MNDEELIELLKKIQEYCMDHVCEYCPLHDDGFLKDCQVASLIESLRYGPCNWDLEQIERIIKA